MNTPPRAGWRQLLHLIGAPQVAAQPILPADYTVPYPDGIIWRDGSGWNPGKFPDAAKPVAWKVAFLILMNFGLRLAKRAHIIFSEIDDTVDVQSALKKPAGILCPSHPADRNELQQALGTFSRTCGFPRPQNSSCAPKLAFSRRHSRLIDTYWLGN